MGLPNDRCGGSLQVCRMRVARLDGAGVPDPGAGNLIVTDALTTLTFAEEVTEGTDFEQQNGCGDICVSFLDDDRFKRVTLEMTICRPDPELVELLRGGDPILSGGDTIGWAAPAVGGAGNVNGVSIEAWTKHIVAEQQDADFPWFRWLFPKTHWRIGSNTLENGVLVLSLSGRGTQNANIFDGPANDLPDTTLSQRAYSYYLDADAPEATCGALTLAAS